MSYRVPENRSVPVPHGIADPPEQDDRWKYWLAVALALLLLCLLLLMGIKSTGTGTQGTASQSTGTEQSGMGRATAESADSGQQTAEEEAAGGGQQTAEEEVADDIVARSDSKETTETAAEEDIPSRESALEDLLRRLDAERDVDIDSPMEESRERKQTGGDALVKGDASVNFFGATGKGSKFVFVFDRSASMRGRPLGAVKRELIQSLDPLKNNHSFNIIAYDHLTEMWKDKLVSATKENKVDAARFIERTGARGGTQPRESLLWAIDQKPEIIFFMTDGEFFLDVDEICRRGRGIVINVVQFSDSLPLVVLQELAKRTGGEFMLINVRGLSDSL